VSGAAELRFMRRLNRRLEQRQAPVLELEPRPAEVQVLEAADFVTGGEADFARAVNARGEVIGRWEAGADETHADFILRANRGTQALGAVRLIIGGIPDLATVRPGPIRPAPPSAIIMPDPCLHEGQIEALRVIQGNRFTALRAGRRFGKSSLAAALAVDTALRGQLAGLFAPIFRLAAPLFDVIAAALWTTELTSNNRHSGELRLAGGGGVDVWPLERPRAGRGQKYGLVVIDEAAFGSPILTTAWNASIRPTLVDLQAPAIIASTPSGVAEDNFFWRVCCDQSYGFVEFVAPTLRNPFIPREEIEALRRQHNPLVFAQEFEAQFVNLAGVGLFDVAAMLNKGEPWPTPDCFDVVFATIDSGVRGGQDHDASAVVYLGLNAVTAPLGLYVLGWEAVELGAGDLELWFAGVGRSLATYAQRTRMGSRGVSIERAGLGEMLLAKAGSLGVPADEIKSEHVARGKDLRALSVEKYINGGQVKLTAPSCNQTSKLKGINRNHLLAQVAGFRIADKDAWRRSDDLVDALIYAVIKAYADE
jgi:hypothetical protein